MRENTEGNRGLIPPHFRVIPDCVMTREPAAPRPSFSILHSPFSVLFASSHVCTPRPRPFPPSSLALALIVCHHHRLRHRRRLITSTRQRSTPTHRHLRFSRSPSARSRILGIAASLPLPLSLSPGAHPRTRHAGTVLHYNTAPLCTCSNKISAGTSSRGIDHCRCPRPLLWEYILGHRGQ